ncbi:MAG: TIGR00730 family Rossman fold protein, partial [Candidatus Binatia bacterium]
MGPVWSLAVFCGSSRRVAEEHRRAAAEIGAALARRRMRLVYGGGRVGLMGILADAALAAGGEVIGVIPDFLFDLELGHTGLSRLERVGTMHERKRRMSELADGFLALSGGLGTLDETIEIITWKQLRLHEKPIVVWNVGGLW